MSLTRPTRQAFCLKTFTSHTHLFSSARSLLIKLAAQFVLEASIFSKYMLEPWRGCQATRKPTTHLQPRQAQY